MSTNSQVCPIGLPVTRNNPFPPFEVSTMRDMNPVHRVVYPDGKLGWLVTDRALGRTVLSDLRLSTNTNKGQLGNSNQLFGGPGWFISMDPPDHTRFRRKLASHFTLRRISQLQPRISKIVESCLDTFECSNEPVDLVTAFAIPISSRVICELIGLNYNTTIHRYSELLYGVERRGTNESSGLFQEVLFNIYETADHRRAQPENDIISDLVSDSNFTEDEVASATSLLLKGGIDTVATMLAMGVFAFISNASQLRANYFMSLPIDHAVEELLRYLSIFQFSLSRIALEDVKIGEITIQAGDRVVVSLPAANHDPTVHREPDNFDLTRSSNSHLTFGHGIHKCIGQHLAKLELKVGYTALFERFPTLALAVSMENITMSSGLLYQINELPVRW